jgi:nitrogen fixation-related uncharacterized protein
MPAVPQPGPLDRPSPQAALALLVPAALCSGLFYLWLGKPGESLLYGCLTGGGLAAIAVEIVKYVRSLHEHPEEGGSAARKALTLFTAAFRIGFAQTFWQIVRALLQIAGLKIVVSALAVMLLYWAGRAGHWF